MRSLIAVIAGFVVVMVVLVAGTAGIAALIIPGGLDAARTTMPPPTYIAAHLLVSAMSALLGGWVTARMAPDREMLHVLPLAALVFLKSVPALVGYGNPDGLQPTWYVYTLPVVSVAAAILGGWLRSRVVVTESATDGHPSA